VQAAPAALLATISTPVLAAASTFAATATTTAVKTITMTALQKTFIAVALTAAIGAGIYEARQAANLHNQVQALEQQQTPLAEQIQRLQRERDEATNKLVALSQENARLAAARTPEELLKLRGQVGQLRQQAAEAAKSDSPSTGLAKLMSNPAMKEFIHQAQLKEIRSRYDPFFEQLKMTPAQNEKFIQAIGGLWRAGEESGAAAGNDREAMTKAMDTAHKEMEQQLKSLLGEEGYDAFEKYNQEIPARTTLRLLNDQLGDNRLTDEQAARLLSIVNSEPFELTHGIAGDLDKAFFGSQQEIDAHLQLVAQSSQRIVQQAEGFLTAAQSSALHTVLTKGIDARRSQGAALTMKN
jgi:hypothetical protein